MRSILLAALSATAFASPVSAMTVQEFVTRGEALEAKGPLALFSDDLEALRLAIRPGLKAWRAQVKTAAPPVCAPPKISLAPQELLDLMREVPVAERTHIDVGPAAIRQLNARYRCK
jgi:hypothetical protein